MYTYMSHMIHLCIIHNHPLHCRHFSHCSRLWPWIAGRVSPDHWEKRALLPELSLSLSTEMAPGWFEMLSGAAPGVIWADIVQLEHVPHAVQYTWFSCLINPVFYYDTDTSIVGSIPWEKCQQISCKDPMKSKGHHRSDCWALSYELGDGHHCERCLRETSRRSRDGGTREEGAVKQHAYPLANIAIENGHL